MNDFDSSLFFTLTGFLQDIDQTLGLSQFSGSLRIVCWEPLEGAERDYTPGTDKRAIVSPHQTDMGYGLDKDISEESSWNPRV